MTVMSLCMPMKFKLRNADYTSHPTIFLSLGGLWSQMMQQQFPTLIGKWKRKC